MNKPSAAFFCSLPKVHLFGLVEDKAVQPLSNYILYGDHLNNKTHNEVITILASEVEPRLVKDKPSELHLTMDNTPRENKNFYVISYLFTLVLRGLVPKIFVHFMVPGHTKNAVDASFGRAKQKLNGLDLFCPNDVLTELRTLANSKAALLRATFNWKDCIAQQFTSIKGISSYHHFWIDRQ